MIVSFLDERREDPELNKKHDIGFPYVKPARSAELKQRLQHLKVQRHDLNLEKLARTQKCR
jgi:large subunit ribosomal protein L38